MAHNAVWDIIGKFCLQSGMAAEREKPNMLLACSGADKRQVTDLVLKENGTVTLVDVTIRNLVALSRLSRTRYGGCSQGGRELEVSPLSPSDCRHDILTCLF